MASDGDDDETKNNPMKGMELTSALARIDQQWQIQQQKAPGQSRWTKLMLPPDGEEQEIVEDPALQYHPNSKTPFYFVNLL